MYGSIHGGSDGALEDLSQAEKMVIQRVSGKAEEGKISLAIRLN